jgi:uncharacterized Tic20 family protein
MPATKDESNWGMIAHLSALAGLVLPPVGNVLGPLIVWLTRRDQSPFVADQAKEALNFNITVWLAGVVCAVLIWALIGILLLFVLGVYWLVMTIIAAVKASEGVAYRYPITLRLVN